MILREHDVRDSQCKGEVDGEEVLVVSLPDGAYS